MHPFQKAISENRDSGLDRAEAVRRARANDPAGFDAWLAEHNAKFDASTAPERHP